MSTLSEQFAAARTAQLNAQFDLFRNNTGKAFASIERLMALNFDTAHSALDKASTAVRQLIATQDPRDLLSLTTQSQQYFESALQYGRQVLRIANGLPAQSDEVLALPAPTPQVPTLGTNAELNFGKVAVEVTVDEPAVEAPAKEKPIAKAAAKASGKRAGAPKPVAAFPAPNGKANGAASSAQKVKPVDAAPPPAPSAGTPAVAVSKKEGAAAKVSKKK